MAALMDDVDAALRIDVEESIFVFTSEPASDEEYFATCALFARAQLCAAASGILSEIDRDIAPLAFSSLVAGDWRGPKSGAQEALAAQSEILRKAGAYFSDEGKFELELARDYIISGSLEIDVVERGSAEQR